MSLENRLNTIIEQKNKLKINTSRDQSASIYTSKSALRSFKDETVDEYEKVLSHIHP